MKLKLAAALLGLAIGGCAHSRSVKLHEGPGSQPIGVDPVPSIHDSINRGTNPAVARATLPDPANPNWSGDSRPDRPPATGLAPRVATTDPPANFHARPEPAAAPPVNPPSQLPRLDPSVAAAPRTAPSDPETRPSSGAQLELPAIAPETTATDAGLGDDLPPIVEPDAPAEPSVQPTPTPKPAAAPPAEDPLLGPNPDLMPAMDDLVPTREAAAKAERPAPEPAPTPTPADEPSLPDLSPAPDAGEAPPELPPVSEPSASAPAANRQSTTLAARPPAPRVDPAVRQVSTTAADQVAADPNLIEAGRAAARVGDEVITLRELVVAVRDQIARHGGKISQIPANELNMIAQTILAGLIERSLVAQEAKRQLKDPKQMNRVTEAANQYWKEQGVPPLLRQYMVENEYQLKEKIAETGRSLETLRQDYIQDFIVQMFVHQKIADKINVELPEMLKYYNEHMRDPENQRAARILWRELLVENDRHPSPADARKKAEDLLARLKGGEDFAKLATAESEGPALIKARGGLMETSPGSYAVAAVNQAIETLPPGEIGGIIEGPSSLHIVRVESRRAAGPASFAELQDQIRQRLTMEKMNRERETLLAKLRANTIVTTIFDGTASDPNLAPDH